MQQLLLRLEVLAKTSGIQLAQVIVTVVGGAMLTHLLCGLLARLSESSPKIDSSGARFIIAVLRLIMYVGIVVLVMIELGMNAQSLLDQAGLVLAALALALKEDLLSLVNGIRILINKPFKQGDHVVVAGVDAVVQSVSLFSTELVTYDNQFIQVPNANVASGTVTNYSKMPTRRVTVTASCAYGTDLEQARQLLRDVVDSHPNVLKKPEPVIRMTDMGANSINFTIYVWAFTDNYIGVLWDLTEAIYTKLSAAGLAKPFNQLDVHLRDLPSCPSTTQCAADPRQGGEP